MSTDERMRRAERDRDRHRSELEARRRGVVPNFRLFLKSLGGLRDYGPNFARMEFSDGWSLSIQPSRIYLNSWELMWIPPPFASSLRPSQWKSPPTRKRPEGDDEITPSTALSDQEVQEIFEMVVQRHGLPIYPLEQRQNPPYSPEELERRRQELLDDGHSTGLADMLLRREVRPVARTDLRGHQRSGQPYRGQGRGQAEPQRQHEGWITNPSDERMRRAQRDGDRLRFSRESKRAGDPMPMERLHCPWCGGSPPPPELLQRGRLGQRYRRHLSRHGDPDVKPNPDERMRELERRARLGDAEALSQLQALSRRTQDWKAPKTVRPYIGHRPGGPVFEGEIVWGDEIKVLKTLGPGLVLTRSLEGDFESERLKIQNRERRLRLGKFTIMAPASGMALVSCVSRPFAEMFAPQVATACSWLNENVTEILADKPCVDRIYELFAQYGIRVGLRSNPDAGDADWDPTEWLTGRMKKARKERLSRDTAWWDTPERRAAHAREEQEHRIRSAQQHAAWEQMPPIRVCLVQCSDSKLPHPAPARDLYMASQLFQQARGFAERRCQDWVVLSALHGMVTPDQVIAPYNLELKKLSKEERARWGHRVSYALRQRFGPRATYVGLASALYLEQLDPDIQAVLEKPLTGMGIGTHKGWLKRNPRRNS